MNFSIDVGGNHPPHAEDAEQGRFLLLHANCMRSRSYFGKKKGWGLLQNQNQMHIARDGRFSSVVGIIVVWYLSCSHGRRKLNKIMVII